MNGNAFDAWLNQIENYGTRAERLFGEVNYDNALYTRMKEWLYAAYLIGRAEGDQIADYYSNEYGRH